VPIQDRSLEGSNTASTPPYILLADRYLLADHRSHFSYLLPHYVLSPPPSSCIYRGSRATFTIKSFIQFFTLQSLQLWARIALPADQSIGSHYLLHHQSTTSFKKSLLLSPLQVSRASSSIKRTDDRPQSTNVPDRRTNWRIKLRVRNVKIRFSQDASWTLTWNLPDQIKL
jgi:hypothetical protein